MKWLRRVLVVVAILLAAIVVAALATALRTERPVGFQVLRATGGDGRAFPVAVWYPTTAAPRPTTLLGSLLLDVAPGGPVEGDDLALVVISHGNGGGPGSHVDLALALADAGYVVAAPMHGGDNYADQGAVGSLAWLGRRSDELHATVSHLLEHAPWRERIDPARIGAFGFSAGGFTVLTAVGGQPDLRLIATHCAASPEFACALLRQQGSPLLRADVPGIDGGLRADPRIRAAVVAAPGLGFTLAGRGLEAVTAPVQLWSAEQDTNVPYATNTGPVRDGLGARAEFHSVPGAGHFSFLAPCGLLRPPVVCEDPGDFDREAFHARMNASVVEFLGRNLQGDREPG